MAWGNGLRTDLSIFIAVPFCRHKCSYCDFNAYAGMDDLIAPYARALAGEIRLTSHPGDSRYPSPLCQWERGKGGEVHTLYFGGGTPSLTPLESLREIFIAIRESFALTSDCEITLEANPGTVTLDYLEGLRALGVNRLSLGVQSAQANELALFGRIHSFQVSREAVQMARRAGFDNVSLDLIYGIPGQTLECWRDTVRRTLELAPDHLSLYSLSLEFGTPMRAWVQRGLLPEPDPDLAADMYEWADEELEHAGFAQYEISNWAKTLACRHNLQYWRNWPYLGFGAGAHGCVPSAALRGSSSGGFRYSNVLSPSAYIERMEESEASGFGRNREISRSLFSPALAESIPIDRKTEMNETMLLGLRLTREGVRKDAFRRRFGIELEDAYAQELKELKERGLIECDESAVRLTRGGRLVANWAFEKFV